MPHVISGKAIKVLRYTRIRADEPAAEANRPEMPMRVIATRRFAYRAGW